MGTLGPVCWDAGINASTMACAIGSSNEVRELVVDELYQQILGHEVDQVGPRVWDGAFANGMTQDQFGERLLTSREFGGN